MSFWIGIGLYRRGSLVILLIGCNLRRSGYLSIDLDRLAGCTSGCFQPSDFPRGWGKSMRLVLVDDDRWLD